MLTLYCLSFGVASADTTSGYTQRQLYQLGINYFDINDESTSGGTACGASNNTDYAGNAVLTTAQLQAIQENQSTYEQAAEQVGIPWQMIAVIHLRETGLKRYNPSNGQGAYQIVSGGYAPSSSLTDAQFLQETIDAANFIKSKNSSLTTTADDAAVKQTFFAYNGQAQAYVQQAEKLGFSADQGYEGSPYVMNRADLKRDPTVEPTKSNNTWGQIKTDGGSVSYPADAAYGAFVVYQSLTGSCNISSNIKNLQDALPLAKEYISEVVSKCHMAQPQEVDKSYDGYLLVATLHHGGDYGCNGAIDGGQCASLSSWFINTHTTYSYSGRSGSGFEVTQLLLDRNISIQPRNPVPTPKPYSIFSTDGGNNHTGVVLSVSGHTIITLEANYPAPIANNGGDDGQVSIRQYEIPSYYNFVYVGDKLKGISN